MNTRPRGFILIILFGLIGLTLSKTLIHILTESWWFQSVGFAEVFWTRLTWQVLIWVTTFVVFSLFLWSNYRIAMHQTRHQAFRFLEESGLEHYTTTFSHYTALVTIFLISLSAAAISSPAWETMLKYLHPTNFGTHDPIFQQDIGFYAFRLPLYEGIRTWFLMLLFCALVLSLLVYLLKGSFAQESKDRRSLAGHAKTHVSWLLAAIAFLIAIGFWLQRYHLLYASNGVVYGAGYADAHARLFACWFMGILAFLVALILLLSVGRQRWRLPILGITLFVIAYGVIYGIYPWVQQQLIVEPNELAKETPYLKHNIQFTQAAYRLNDIQRQQYAADPNLNQQVLQANQPTIRNIRLWDYRPLLSTYRQLQEIRLYYRFHDVDVDRYRFNDQYQQVMLSARELAYAQLPQEAQTWVNQRLKYTHGYGLVMSPVNRANSDGLPELYVKDIPPVSQVNLPIRQPAIYYGEETNHFIFTGTTTQEFDYPQGADNASTFYHGVGGVPMPSVWHRLAYSYDLGSLQILISNYFTNQSRIHYYRQIRERVHHIAPFLRLDNDPYMTVINGRLQWILDAYTVSDRYPYSEPVAHLNTTALLKQDTIEPIIRGNVNYIRNSVKVVIDAYDGTLQFFTLDESDPVLQTYRAIFPHLFQPRSAVPAAVKAHFRYPQNLFEIQSQMFLTYHMSAPEVFYNREDLWRFPIQTYEGAEQVMEPYYVIMRLPGEATEGFILILPFTPANKDNMIAWMAARSNGQDYGKLLLYEFPKQKLVFGPRQIEARIDQDPKISQQFTLWSQAGSKVIRGDLLVIPIEESLLYVEPVYLRAEQGELPELKRVILAYDKSVVMENTLEQAIAAIFGSPTTASGATPPLTGASSALIQSALDTYQKAETAARQGNWADYGRYQQELKTILQQLKGSQIPHAK